MDIKLDFLEFTPTPKEKYEGVVSLKITTDLGPMIFRFQILKSKKDGSLFYTSMGYRVTKHGEETFLRPFHFENTKIDEEIHNLLKEKLYPTIL